jgi:deoxyribonuclease-4
MGCQVIQIFSGTPRAWRTTPLDRKEAPWFAWALDQVDIRPLFIHVPYLVNMASPDPDIQRKSVAVMRDAVKKATLLGGGCLVAHVGSHQGEGTPKGLKRLKKSVDAFLSNAPPEVLLLLEGGAGAGDAMANSFTDLAACLEALDEYGSQVGVCLDTAHLFAAGYDISHPTGIESTVVELEQVVGVKRVKLIHANDTDAPLGSHRDHHVNPPGGLLGPVAFRVLLTHPKLREIPFISEADFKKVEEGKKVVDALKVLAK